MIKKQQQRIEGLVAEKLGGEVDAVLLAYEGPRYVAWVIGAVLVGIVVFVVIGLGGIIGGAIVGAVVGSYFLFAHPFVIARGSGETSLIRMHQPAFAGGISAEEVLERDPLGRVPIVLSGRTITYGDRSFQVLPFWAGAAKELEQSGS